MKIVTELNVSARPVRAGHDFSPKLLFSSGQRGAFYDISDGRHMYADLAATVMSGPGDAVARLDDTSGNGYHAIQATAAARPIHGRHPASGIRNLLTHSEAFDPAATPWTLGGGGNPTYSVVNSEQRVSWSNGKGNVYQNLAAEPVAGETWTLRFRVKVIDLGGAGASDFELSIKDGDQIEEIRQPITVVDDGAWHDHTVSITFSAPSGVGSYVHFRHTGSASPVIAFQNAQLEVGTAASAYQKVTTRYDITETGQRDIHYLYFDGVDDFLSAGDVLDFGSSDRTAAFAMESLTASEYGSFLGRRGTGAPGNHPGWGLRSEYQRLYLEYDDGAGLTSAFIGDAGGLAGRAVHVAEIEFGAEARSYRNGVLSTSTADLSTLGNSSGGFRDFNLGGQPASYEEMRFYGAVVREGLLRGTGRAKLETFLAQRTGVTL